MMQPFTSACLPVPVAYPIEESSMSRNIVRAILGILLVAAARKLTDLLVDRVFGPDEQTA